MTSSQVYMNMSYGQLRARYFDTLFMYYGLDQEQRDSEFGRQTIVELRKMAEIMNTLTKMITDIQNFPWT